MDTLITLAYSVLVLLPLWAIAMTAFMWFTTWPQAKTRWASDLEETRRSQSYDPVLPGARTDGPPTSVRLAALGSWLLGSMFFPGVPLCIGGLLLMGMGVFGVPALFLACRSFLLGGPLLMGEASSVRRARVLALFTVLINGGTLATVAWWVVTSMPDFHSGRAYPTPITVWGFFGVAIALAAHAVASLLHAALLVRAAKAIEALHAAATQGMECP